MKEARYSIPVTADISKLQKLAILHSDASTNWRKDGTPTTEVGACQQIITYGIDKITNAFEFDV
jgi:hypothetical protein